MSNERSIFKTAALAILRPLIRIALRNQITYQLFDEWVKRAYIEVAEKEFSLEKRKPSDSRTSLLTGLTRKVIRHIKSLDPEEFSYYETYHRSTKLISAWNREPEYSDKSGKPKALPFSGESSFESLVKANGQDIPARAMLDELKRLGIVLEKGQRLFLQMDSFAPESPESDAQLHILGQDVSALVDTIDHNTYRRDQKKMFQRHVRYVGIPVSVIPKLDQLTRKKGQQFLEDFDEWLSKNSRNTQDEETKTILIGIYYNESDSDVSISE